MPETTPHELAPNQPPARPTRRQALLAGGAAVAAGAVVISRTRVRRWPKQAVFIAAGQRYDGPLRRTIEEGLQACGIEPPTLRGMRILLKPNLVEPHPSRPHMTTHPAVIAAAIAAFRGWGAEVAVGEAPGHMRDSRQAVEASGLGEILRAERLRFADLNYQPSAWRPNRGRCSTLQGLHLPQSVVEADLIVSLPKLKTHHWAGVTCSMKNLYGVLPGLKYGWPKNVLHHHGIPQTVADINCSVGRTLAIVDAIDCMEGDGPILGSCKTLGLVIVGASLPAVDATAARIMDLDPNRVSYLQLARELLGPIDEGQIEQRGEPWKNVASRFALVDAPHLRALRADGNPQGADNT